MNKFLLLCIVLSLVAFCSAECPSEICTCVEDICTSCKPGYFLIPKNGDIAAKCEECLENTFSVGGTTAICDKCLEG